MSRASPALDISVRVLNHAGFIQTGGVRSDGTITYELRRSVFESH